MRPLAALLLAALAAPLLLAGCAADRHPLPARTACPTTRRSAAIDPSHTYRFGFGCTGAAANSLVHITTDGVIGSINVTCNSSTELGAAYGSTFGTFGYEITLDGPAGKVCSLAGVTRTGCSGAGRRSTRRC
jgi:hypothetical protein